MAESKKWVITTSGEQSITDIQTQLSESGFKIDEVLDQIGCITGSADEAVAKQLRTIPGVVDVSPEPPTIDIGPPNESFTW